jgi:hypothetical protein
MNYLKNEIPIAIALLILGGGFALEHSAVDHGGIALWGLLLIILAAIVGGMKLSRAGHTRHRTNRWRV